MNMNRWYPVPLGGNGCKYSKIKSPFSISFPGILPLKKKCDCSLHFYKI